MTRLSDAALILIVLGAVVLLTLVCADWVAQRMAMRDRVLVCVSGWRAEDDGRSLRMVRHAGTLVPCDALRLQPPAVDLRQKG